MSAKKIKIKQEDKSAAIDYLKKAEDNYAQMIAALEIIIIMLLAH